MVDQGLARHVGYAADVAQMTDEQLAVALDRAIAIIDPVIDVLADADPLGLKAHTFHDDVGHSRLERAQHLLAEGLDVADWPGTKGWAELSMNDRASWWINRIGALNTVAVAYPGMFGAWAKALPLALTLGFANQAMVLIAIAREYGVTDRTDQIRLLAAVLSNRDLDATTADAQAATALPTQPLKRAWAIFVAPWKIAQILRRVNDELGNRPKPARPFSLLGYIPVVGAPALYVGERLALCDAVKAGRTWISLHPEAISVSRPPDGSVPDPHA